MNALMKEQAARCFAAIGSESRLDVLTYLVRAGEDGLPFKDIQERTGLPPSTLAHHLKSLVLADLVTQEQRGRATVSRPNYPRLEALSAYILEQCCADHPGCSDHQGGDKGEHRHAEAVA